MFAEKLLCILDIACQLLPLQLVYEATLVIFCYELHEVVAEPASHHDSVGNLSDMRVVLAHNRMKPSKHRRWANVSEIQPIKGSVGDG